MKLKKILAVVSALCMMAIVIPILPVQETAVISVNAEEAEYTTGTYENLNYKKYADHIEISGVTDKEAITEVNIPAEIDGLPVTTIGNKAFFNCSGLISVTLPDSLTTIGNNTFSECYALTSVTLPDNLATIGDYAFFNCSSLTSVTLPDSITSISSSSLAIPNLTAIEVSENNPNYVSADGVLFSKDKTELICYPAGNPRTEYIVSANVTSIKKEAFGLWENQSALNSVTIENPDCEIPLWFIVEYQLSDNIDASIAWCGFNGIIYGYENSTAQKVAEQAEGYQFTVIGSAPETSETESESQSGEMMPGDADSNQKIDILDVITLNKAVMGKETLSENSLKAIDFNQNGKPDSEESLTLLKYIVGLITDLTA